MNASLSYLLTAATLALLAACSGDSSTANDDDQDAGRTIPDAGVSDSGTDASTSDALDDTSTDDGSPSDADGSADVASEDTTETSDAQTDGADDTEVSEDITDTGSSDDVDTVDAAPACDDSTWVWSGVLLEDINGGTLDVGDSVRITAEILSSEVRAQPLRLQITHSNIGLSAGSFRLDDAPITPTVAGAVVTLDVDDSSPATLTYEGTVESSEGLLSALAVVEDAGTGCDIARSRSGAFFQITGGETKTPTCIDMQQYRSMQVAPFVAKQNTDAYATRNGVRDDLRADEFIFCPQSPTIVHQAEFCMRRAPGQNVAFAGSYAQDGSWEVDDFILVEVVDGETIITDGFTTQHHTGRPNTFYCGATDRLMCETDCTAALIDIDSGRRITPIADVTAEGPTARQHVDGAVSISGLLPASGEAVDVRITALDTGVEGTLTPALYLVSETP